MLGLRGTLAGAALGAVAAGSINAAQIPVPLAGQIFLLPPSFFVSIHPMALLKSVGIITAVTGLPPSTLPFAPPGWNRSPRCSTSAERMPTKRNAYRSLRSLL